MGFSSRRFSRNDSVSTSPGDSFGIAIFDLCVSSPGVAFSPHFQRKGGFHGALSARHLFCGIGGVHPCSLPSAFIFLCCSSTFRAFFHFQSFTSLVLGDRISTHSVSFLPQAEDTPPIRGNRRINPGFRHLKQVSRKDAKAQRAGGGKSAQSPLFSRFCKKSALGCFSSLRLGVFA